MPGLDDYLIQIDRNLFWTGPVARAWGQDNPNLVVVGRCAKIGLISLCSGLGGQKLFQSRFVGVAAPCLLSTATCRTSPSQTHFIIGGPFPEHLIIEGPFPEHFIIKVPFPEIFTTGGPLPRAFCYGGGPLRRAFDYW